MLTFTLGQEIYGVDIQRVQEIRRFSPATHIPQSPADCLGVIHLRGSIVPILDLRLRFELGSAAYNAMTVIIVLTAESASGAADVGVVVDSVREVADFDGASLRPAPNLGRDPQTEFVKGMLPVGERMVVLLDVERLIGSQILQLARAASSPLLNPNNLNHRNSSHEKPDQQNATGKKIRRDFDRHVAADRHAGGHRRDARDRQHPDRASRRRRPGLDFPPHGYRR
jgi:purine-binding chemotaxis protein CheW